MRVCPHNNGFLSGAIWQLLLQTTKLLVWAILFMNCVALSGAQFESSFFFCLFLFCLLCKQLKCMKIHLQFEEETQGEKKTHRKLKRLTWVFLAAYKSQSSQKYLSKCVSVLLVLKEVRWRNADDKVQSVTVVQSIGLYSLLFPDAATADSPSSKVYQWRRRLHEKRPVSRWCRLHMSSVRPPMRNKWPTAGIIVLLCVRLTGPDSLPSVLLCNAGGNFPSTIAEADGSREFFPWSEFVVITSAMSSDAASFFRLGKISSSATSKCGPVISSRAGCIAGLEL